VCDSARNIREFPRDGRLKNDFDEEQTKMNRLLGRWVGCLGALALVTAFTSAARADYSLQVVTGSFDTGQITAASPFAQPSSTAGSVTVDTLALNTFLAGSGFAFDGLAGKSNALTPGDGSLATLTQFGGVGRVSADGTGTITIIAQETGFNFPVGTPKFMTGAAADTFLNFATSDSRTFEGQFTDANGTVSTITQTFAASKSSQGNTETGPFAGQDSYTLTSVTVINLGFNPNGVATDQFSGTTTVLTRAVPEPASIALLLMGGLGLAVRHRRNVKRAN